MTAEQPIEMLVEEHRVIEWALTSLEAAAEVPDGQPFPVQFFESAVEFLSSFAGGYHLAKEEDRLFPLLWEKGVPLEKGPLGGFMEDHKAAVRHLEDIRVHLAAAEQGVPEARAAIRSLVRDLVRALREHMRKEEQRLFNVARGLLDPADRERLLREFEEVDQEYMETAFQEPHGALAGAE